MLPTNNDKKNLIQSMKKLTNHISNNSNRQAQIFNSLSINDLNKIIENLHDQNQYLRRISALLVCELLYNNPQLKQAFVFKLNIQPNHGRICINGINQSVQKYPTTLKKCIELMKSNIRKGQEDCLCWAINLDKKNLHIEHFQFKKYSSFTFLDPMRNIFGICVPSTSKTEEEKQPSILTQSVSVQLDPKKDKNLTSSGMYSRKYNHPSQQLDSKRPSTSKERDSSISSSKEPNFKYIKLKDFAFTKVDEKPKYFPTKQKPNTTIHAATQYSRNSYGRQREKHSVSFNQAMQDINDSYRQKTDRRLKERNLDLMIDMKRSSMDGKYPQSTKNQHENFYKRVQQILRK